VSVIVPCRNEDAYLDAFLESLFAQSICNTPDELEVVVCDGMSDDGTRERLKRWQQRRPELVVIDNPQKTTSAGLNTAIHRARGDIIVRMDVHTVYDPHYIVQCVRVLDETGATCVGGPWRPVVADGPGRAIACAFRSRIASGGARSRALEYTGPVDTVYLGAWRRQDLLRLGGFDEHLVRNQDDELNLRIRRGGGQVWQSATICSFYTPRESMRALFRQFYQYGYWKVPVILKHRLPASGRHVIPFGFVAAVVLLFFLGFFVPVATAMLIALILIYGSGVLISVLMMRERAVLSICLAVVCMHIGYGVGFGHGILDFVLRRRGADHRMTRLTR